MNAASTFAERLEFGRVRHHALGTWREDQEIAAQIGVKPSSFNEIKRREEAPSAGRTLSLARTIEVDPGWLAFGADSAAPAPEGFGPWLANKRAREEANRVAAVAQLPKFDVLVTTRTPGMTRSRDAREAIEEHRAKKQPAKKKRGTGGTK